jgi:hypothetical protein
VREVRRFAEAIDVCTRAAAALIEVGDRDREGRALTNLGAALREVRRFGEAIDATPRPPPSSSRSATGTARARR